MHPVTEALPAGDGERRLGGITSKVVLHEVAYRRDSRIEIITSKVGGESAPTGSPRDMAESCAEALAAATKYLSLKEYEESSDEQAEFHDQLICSAVASGAWDKVEQVLLCLLTKPQTN